MFRVLHLEVGRKRIFMLARIYTHSLFEEETSKNCVRIES